MGRTMNKALWISRKNYLATLIKRVSAQNGGDDKNFLDLHHIEICEAHPGYDIELAIRVYEELLQYGKLMEKGYDAAVTTDKEKT